MRNEKIEVIFDPTFNITYYKKFSDMRHKAISLCAEVGLPMYKIHHSIAISDAALLIASEVEKQIGVKVNYEICETGALLHDVGISQIITDDMPEHTYIGAQIARAAGFAEEVARCIEVHDCGGLVKEYCQLINLPISSAGKDDLVPDTWEEKIVAYADTIVSLEGEWQMDVWNDNLCPAKALYYYLAKALQVRRGLILPKNHPQIIQMIEFNKSMRRFAPRDKYEALLRPRINRMVDSINAAGIKTPFPSLEDWPYKYE